MLHAIDYEADIESDLSVFHRIDDPMSIDGPRYFRLVLRLPAYMGVMQARAADEREEGGQSYQSYQSPGHPAPANSGTPERPTRVSEEVLLGQLSDGWVEHTITEGI